MTVSPLRLPVTGAPVDTVTAAVHTPSSPRGPAVLLTPGAGGDLDGAGLVALADVLAAAGCPVVRANLPHREAGRAAPRADRSVAALTEIAEAARAEVASDRPWVVGGKSYGGRVASLAVAGGHLDVAGLLLYGYPLHPPGKPEQLRTDHWHDLAVPVLFLQGSHDPFGSADEVRAHLSKLPRRATVVEVEGGDHSLDVAKKRSPDGVRRPGAEVLAGLAPRILTWLETLAE